MLAHAALGIRIANVAGPMVIATWCSAGGFSVFDLFRGNKFSATPVAR